MNSSRIQLLVTGVAVWVCSLIMLTTTCGAGSSIIIGGDYTDVGAIIIISPKPGDTQENNGTALLNNLADIVGSSNRYLIKLGPGIYDVGTTSVQMKEFVDVEGSGENMTIIIGRNSSIANGVVNGANNAELRSLTVINSGGVTDAIAVYCGYVSPRITNVTARVSGGVNNYGVYSISSVPKMTNVTSQATGAGTNYAIYNYNCTNAMTMTNVSASSVGGTWNFGVYNKASSPVMINVNATGLDGTESYGVYNESSSPPMRDVRAVASGAVSNYAVYNQSSAPQMVRVIASGNTGTYSYGLYNSASSGTYTMRIDQSSFEGLPNSIYNDSEYTLYIGASKLRGPANSAGSYHCVGVYTDTTYTELGQNCQ